MQQLHDQRTTAARGVFLMQQRQAGLVFHQPIHRIERLATGLGCGPTRIAFGHCVHRIDTTVGTHADHPIPHRAPGRLGLIGRQAPRRLVIEHAPYHPRAEHHAETE